MDVKDPRAIKAGEIFASRMESYPKEIQIAMGVTMSNIMKGCPWGIVTGENKEFMASRELFAKSNVVSAYQIKSQPGLGKEDKYLILTTMKTMVNILNKEGFGVFEKKELDHALKKRDDAIKGITKFLQSGKIGEIGIFSTNESKEIVINGVSYPAFAITLVDLISYCTMYNYCFLIGGKRFKPEVLMKNIDKVYQNLQPAPSGNALLIKIVR